MGFCQKLKSETPEDRVHYALDDKHGLVFIHQTSQQRLLLSKYGQELCLLDATYKTTKYACNLFFIAVKTNTDYQVRTIIDNIIS